MSNIFSSTKYRPFLALFCALGWSLAYPLIKVGYGEFGISGTDMGSKILFAGVRFTTAGALVLLFCLIKGVKSEMTDKTDFVWLLLLSLVNTTLHYMFAYIGLGFNSSARATILDSMGGFFLIILSVILFTDDRITKAKIVGCMLGVAGIISINIAPGTNFFENITFWGDGMILLNACCTGFGGILTRVVSKKMNMMKGTGLSMFIGGGILIFIGFVVGPDKYWTWTVKGIVVLTILILISAVCFAVYNELLAHHPISKIAIFNALIPVLGVIFAALLLQEELKWQYFVAVLLVACGIFFVNFKKKA